jgi:molybdopterin-containing oxidoreductase family iron-sulfur binding subunit
VQGEEREAMKYAMVIDLNQCVGCDACTVACKLGNDTGTDIRWGRVITEELGAFPDVKKLYVPILCMQCENAECLKVCPTKATYRDERGLVLIDYDKCIGCKYCMEACPYMARHFNEAKPPPQGVPVIGNGNLRKGIVEKCTFCEDRLSDGKPPRCVEACPYDARVFGDLEDPEADVTKLVQKEKPLVMKPDGGYNPSVYYTGVK